MSDGLPVIVIGAGGHAKVVIGALKASGATILGATDPDPATHGTRILGVPVLGADDKVGDHPAGEVLLVNGVGSTRPSERRKAIHDRFREKGYAFCTVLHPSAVVGDDVEISDGAQVMAGVVIQPGCRVGANAIVNTAASVDHDCVIGAHVHVAPGAVLGGAVRVDDGAHVGAGATVIQNVAIGAGALVAAGTTVIADVPADGRVAGVPARSISHA